MKALVINLDSEVERMAFQEKQLKHLGIDFQRIPAFKIDTKEDSIYQEYYNTWQRPMSISEVSCFFSHKHAWSQVIEQNYPILILEDDAVLSKDVSCILKELSKLKDIDYVNLEDRKNRKKLLAKTSKAEFCNSSLIRLYQGRSGAAGYILWPSGAKKLLDKMENYGIGIADKFINDSYSLNAYQIEPATIIQVDQCKIYGVKPPLKVKSSIINNTNPSLTKKQWRFRLRRIIGELRIGLNHIRHITHASRRRIKLSYNFNKKS